MNASVMHLVGALLMYGDACYPDPSALLSACTVAVLSILRFSER